MFEVCVAVGLIGIGAVLGGVAVIVLMADTHPPRNRPKR